MSDERTPVEADTFDYKHSQFYSLSNDAWNDALGAYRAFSRVAQWMDRSSGRLPSVGDRLNVEFDDGSYQQYEIVEVLPQNDVVYKDADKYKFRCVLSEDADDYPSRITIGARTGSYGRA